MTGATLALVLAFGASAPAGAGPGTTPALSVTPQPGLDGQTITVAPADANGACPGVEVDLTYVDFNGGGAMHRTVTLDSGSSSDDMWSDQLTFDASHYIVSATCQLTNPAPNAGHLAVAGQPSFSYATHEIQINGEINGASVATVGQTLAFGPNARSLCPNGTVALSLLNPDGSITVPLAPTVDGSGSWSVSQTFNAPGTYRLRGDCFFQRVADAGHLAASGLSNGAVLFSYIDHQIVVTAPVLPDESPPANPVVANANFTG